MKHSDDLLLKGSLWKNILLFSIPLILSNFAQILFNISDLAIVGKFSTPTALGEVGSTSTLVVLFTGFLIGMGNGVNVVIARMLGQKDSKAVKETLHTSFLLCLIVGIVILILGLSLFRVLLNILHTKLEFIDGAILYLKIYFLGMPALAIYNFGNAVYSAYGNTKKPLFFLLLAGLINIGLNFFFVLVCHMSVEGVAIASVSSQYISSFLIINSLMKEKGLINFSFKKIKLYKNRSKTILYLGIISGLQSAIFSIANLFIQSGINSLDSIMVEGNAAAQNADAIIYDAMAGFYMAGSTFISQNYGAGNKKRVRNSFLISLIYSFSIAVLLSAFLIVFGRNFLSLFTNKQEVIEAGMTRIIIMGCSYAFSAFMDAPIAGSRGLGKSLVPTIIVILGSCVFRIIWLYTIFAKFKTASSLYLLYIFSWTITATIELIYFTIIFKKKTKNIEITSII